MIAVTEAQCANCEYTPSGVFAHPCAAHGCRKCGHIAHDRHECSAPDPATGWCECTAARPVDIEVIRSAALTLDPEGLEEWELRTIGGETDMPPEAFTYYEIQRSGCDETAKVHVGEQHDLAMYLVAVHPATVVAMCEELAQLRKDLAVAEKLLAERDSLAVALWEDHRADATVHLFSDRGRAEEWARTTAREHEREAMYREEEHEGALIITYAVEGDCAITVFDLEVDADA